VLTAAQPPAWEYRACIEAYAHAEVNYDLARQVEYTSATGWRIDDYTTGPAAEGLVCPKPPVLCRRPGGAAFPPPDLITGYFDPAVPLGKSALWCCGRTSLVFNLLWRARDRGDRRGRSAPRPTGPKGCGLRLAAPSKATLCMGIDSPSKKHNHRRGGVVSHPRRVAVRPDSCNPYWIGQAVWPDFAA
jgi:hypothetical protein